MITDANTKIVSNILKEWEIDVAYFTEVVTDNPSLRGMILGYIAERKLKDLFVKIKETADHQKADDHNREKKGDLTLTYKGEEITIEVKSLQTNSIEIELPDLTWLPMISKVEAGRKDSIGLKKDGSPKLGQKIYKYTVNQEFLNLSQEFRQIANYRGTFQCDASDKREVTLNNGEKVNTTLLKVGEFDVIAAGIFSFRKKWEFGFALNEDLPRSDSYDENSSHLIASLVNISLPLQPPFVKDPIEVFEKILAKRLRG